jgi:hypothetical protein
MVNSRSSSPNATDPTDGSLLPGSAGRRNNPSDAELAIILHDPYQHAC